MKNNSLLFVKVKSGLKEKKHREAMGVRWWLYFHMLDIADWETGTCYGWTDAQAAKELGMNVRTVRRQRVELEEAGYIKCVQGFQSQRIIINNWTNPRGYHPTVSNPNTETMVDGDVIDEADMVTKSGHHEPMVAKSGHHHPYTKVDTLPFNTDLNIKQNKKQSKNGHHPTLKRTELSELRKHFSSVSRIPEPKWNDLSPKEKKRYGASWNSVIKSLWVNAGKDVERTKLAISHAVKTAEFTIYSPQSIQNVFQKSLSEIDTRKRKELPNARNL